MDHNAVTDDEARTIAKATVREMMAMFGLDADEPGELQKDFAFLRSWRESTAAVRRQGLLTAVGVIVVAFLGLIWLAIRGGAH